MTDTWVFFDLGDTLLNEDRLRYRLFQMLLEAIRAEGTRQITFRELIDLRETYLRNGRTAVHYAIAGDILSPAGYDRWAAAVAKFVAEEGPRWVFPIPGAREALAEISLHPLGIVADQPRALLAQFAGWGFEGVFSVIALDSLVGFHKPDLRLYQWALEEARCAPPDGIMVGNRIETDVLPAKKLGMRTILCDLPVENKGWAPSGGDEILYFQSLANMPNWVFDQENLPHDIEPDAVARDLREIPALVETLSNN